MKQKQTKRTNKKKNNKIKLIFIAFMLLIIGFIVVKFVFLNNNSTDEPKKKVVDEIKKFSYVVSDADTKLFKEKFKLLKSELSKKNINNKEYAKLISELFVIDFYTLDNKSNKNDIGGTQFVYTSHKTDFIEKARHGMYKQVQSNLDDDRKQSLPEVSTVEVIQVEEIVPSTVLSSDDFKESTNTDAYEIKLKWTYKNNDDFQKEATIVVVKDGDKLSIAKLN